MSDQTPKKSKRAILKIIVPVLLLCVVVGIWAVKNSKAGTVSDGNGNPDFALHVTQTLDLEKLKSYGLPIIVDFGADSCIPCKEMAPVLKELNEELQGRAIVKFVDVWKYEDLAKGYPIDLIPTQIFIDAKGKPYQPQDPELQRMRFSSQDTGENVFMTHVGSLTKDHLLQVLKEMGLK